MTAIHDDNAVLEVTLQWADTSLVLGHRLSEWCGHGPVLEQDMALTNMALDYIGEARSLYQYAADQIGEGKTEDDLAFLRDAREYRNLLLVELPNGDFAQTILRVFLYEMYHRGCLEALCQRPNRQWAAVAEKSLKEARYHVQWSAEWVIRLGDGTEESRRRMLEALELLWPYTGELFVPSKSELALIKDGEWPPTPSMKSAWLEEVKTVFERATLPMPASDIWMHEGGKNGYHSEHLGYLLAEMQFLQRSYPGNQW